MPTIEKKYFYTLDEYQRDAMRTDTAHQDGLDGILNALMGINGEAGEAIDILKKHMYQGAELDMEHLIKEVGDVLCRGRAGRYRRVQHQEAEEAVSEGVRGGAQHEQGSRGCVMKFAIIANLRRNE